MKAAIDPNAYPGADEKELGQLRWVLKLADKPLAQADTLLDVRDKSVLPKYDATDNIKKPDLSKLRKSTIEDYQARDMYGLLKGDIAIGFVGRGGGALYIASY